MQVSLPNPITTYATDNGTNLDTGMNQLFTDVGNALNRQNIDLSRYDSDNDGSVDELVLVAAGSRDQATGGVANSTFWSINYPRNFLTPYNIGNGSNTKRVDKMIMLSEFTGPSFRTRIGVFAHELMHTFNMPDLYDLVDTTLTIPPRVRDEGIGNWGLMGGGNWLPNGQGTQPVHPSAYIKSKLGWINTERKITHGIGSPNRPENLTFSPFIGNRQGNVRKCSSRANSKEYFLMENRTRTSGFFERQLPGEGLLVWHINENEPDNKSGRGNDSRLVTLEQADGNNNLGQPLGAPQSNTGDQSDPFPGSLVISTLTRNGIQNPSTDYYSGQDSGFSLVNINRNNLNRNITATYSCKSFNFIWLLPLTLIATFRRRNTTNQ